MSAINLSVEEMIFCLYNEGFYSSGLSFKENYFPDMNDDELRLVFQVACRSLLAKGMVELSENHYNVKEEYKPYIKAINYSPNQLKTSKFLPNKEQEIINIYIKKNEFYSHSFLYNQQVHQLVKLDMKEVNGLVEEFYGIEGMINQSDEIFVCTGDEFETLLEGITENRDNKLLDFLSIVGDNECTKEFINDLKINNGKLNTIMKFTTNEGTPPDLTKIVFVLSGEETTWFISGSERNAFTLKIANKEDVHSLIAEDLIRA